MKQFFGFASSANDNLSLVKRSVGLLVAMALLLVFLPFAHAQIEATVSGTVQDPSGAVIPGAQVTLTNEATKDTRLATSNAAGFFAFPSLVPGTYTVSATAKGFVPKEFTGIVLHAGESRTIPNFALAVGSATQTVTVEASSQIIPLTTGSRSEVLDYRDIQNVALEGRDVTEMLKVLPGVVQTPNGLSNGASFNALTVTAQTSSVGNGLNVSGAEYRGPQQLLSDGVNVIDPGDMGGSIGTINPEMVQEMTVLTSNFGADQEFGPVVISTISKSGTDRYHGEAYFDARNDVLNANDWQSNHQGLGKGGASYYYPGGNIGGYVPKTHKKLFFWGGYERWLQNQGNANILSSYIPSPEMMAGDFTTDNADNQALCPNGFGPKLTGWCQDLSKTVYSDGSAAAASDALPGWNAATQTDNGQSVPSQFILPSSTALASFWPKANANPATTPGGYNYYQPIINHVNGWVWRARIDWNPSDRDKLYISYQQEFSSSLDQGNGAHIYWTPGNSVPYPGGGLFQFSYTKTAAGHFIHVFNSTTTNEVTASWGYGNLPNQPANTSGAYRTTFGYPTDAGYGQVFSPGSKLAPAYNTGGTDTFPDFSQGDDYEPSGVYQVRKQNPAFADDFTKVVGSHTLKFGAFTMNTANYQGGGQQMNGIFSFGQSTNPISGHTVGSNNQTANFIMGSVTGYNESNKSPNSDMAYQIVSFYGNDNWKVNNKLNIEIGARLEHVGHWYDRTGVGMAVFYPSRVASDYYSGKSEPGFYWHGISSGVPLSGQPNRLAFLSPRFGMAYDVFGTGKTMIRGGWGAYRWQDQYNDFAADLQTAQNIRSYSLPGGNEILQSQVGLINTPFCANIPACKLIQPAAVAGEPGFVPGTGQYGSYTGANPTDYGIPLTYSWNLTVDQHLPWNTLLDVAYVGSSSSQMTNNGESSNGSAFGAISDQNKTPIGALFLPDPATGLVATNPENVLSTCTTAIPEVKNQYGVVTTVGVPSQCNQFADYHPFGFAYGTNSVYMHTANFFSNYNALQASWTKRAGRLSFDFNFTWQKQLGTAALQVNPFDVRANYGILNVNRPYLFNSNYIYQFGELIHGNNAVLRGAANGWTISGISSWQAGGSLMQENQGNFAQSITTSYDPATLPVNDASITTALGAPTYYGTDAPLNRMPVLTCNPKSSLGKNQLLNQDCFAAPAIGQYGGKKYPYMGNAAFIENDLALYKTFEIRGSQNVQFRISAFNWMNHPLRQFSSNNQLTLRYTADYNTKALTLNKAGDSSTWGVLDSKAGAPNQRIIELNVKYNF